MHRSITNFFRQFPVYIVPTVVSWLTFMAALFARHELGVSATLFLVSAISLYCARKMFLRSDDCEKPAPTNR